MEDQPQILGSVSFEVKGGKINEVMTRVNEFLAAVPQVSQYLSVVAEGHRICVGIKVPNMLGKGALDPHQDMIDKVQDDLKVDQNIELTIRLAASPKDLLSEGAEPFLTQLFKGLSFDVKLNVWKKIADVLLKIIENGDLDASLLPIFGGLAPAFLLKISGKLDIDVDEYMQSKLMENPLLAPAMMDAHTLIQSISSVSSDEEFDA